MDSRTDTGATIEDDSGDGGYRASFDETRARPSLALVEVFAAIEGRDPTALEPLGTTIDVDALDTVLRCSDTGRDTEVTFQYSEYEVTIRGDGTIEVLPIDSNQEP